MFDWVNDIIKLPEIPKALAYYNGRAYVFTETKLYRIEMSNFYIEDVLEGFGVTNNRSVTVCDYGMFWANKYNIYRMYNTQIDIIGDRIADYWRSVSASLNSIVYDTEYNMVILNSGVQILYNTLKDRFDIGDNATYTSLIYGIKGVSLASASDGLYKLFSSTNNMAFVVITKEFTFGDNAQLKYFYKIKTKQSVPSGSALTITYSLDGGTTWVAPSATSTSGNLTIRELKSSGNWITGNTLMLRIAGTDSSNTTTLCNAYLDSIQIIWRRKIATV